MDYYSNHEDPCMDNDIEQNDLFVDPQVYQATQQVFSPPPPPSYGQFRNANNAWTSLEPFRQLQTYPGHEVAFPQFVPQSHTYLEPPSFYTPQPQSKSIHGRFNAWPCMEGKMLTDISSRLLLSNTSKSERTLRENVPR